MRTAIRKPKVNKPTKGMKNFFKQQKNSLKKVMSKVANTLIPKPKQQWYTRAQSRAIWLHMLNRSKWTQPHQGSQERARRVRQMAACTHGYPQNIDHLRIPGT